MSGEVLNRDVCEFYGSRLNISIFFHFWKGWSDMTLTEQ